ncbi:lipopolysaccharide-induced tumor necrosis factor-alpha factor homolog isoform X2 [Pectinophora gossypiella]|uniref:lipopolysaccharide-induced tumor necrosis factor-alpha factor homolog isoform X2 n=1 Tax=Pectinophora gossypiella TaxID=13191 RepID=UPI00214F2286|nr:lipopolysaccharide-induced tumor necrosis factor-alpha factor homolog isoform X2 [Pectinophora gossypiella]
MAEKGEHSTFSDVYQPQPPPPSYQQSQEPYRQASQPAYQQAPQPVYQQAPQPVYHQPQPGIPPGMTVVHPSTLTGYSTNGVTVVNHTPGSGTVTMVPIAGTTVVSAVVVPAIGPNPTAIQCRSCQQRIVTRVSYTPSIRTHLSAGILCLFGCWPCVCLPYCIDTCNCNYHYCPNCNAFIGSYI